MAARRVFLLAGGYLLAEGLALRHGHKAADCVYVFTARILREHNFNATQDVVLSDSTFCPKWIPDFENIVAELTARGYQCSV